MKIKAKDFRVREGATVNLSKWPTLVKRVYKSKEQYQQLLAAQVGELSALQQLHYASNRYAVLLIFQAMDAAGKDSCIDHVLSGVNPQGCSVTAFKQPSAEELAHDFLWRHAKAVPERGMIGVHNRSHYEEVLVVKVHPEYLLGQRLPGIERPEDANAAFWERRYASIRAWEEHITANGVTIMKFFLHMGRKEQRKRFLERIDDPRKNWKFSLGDVKERARFGDYMNAYEDAIRATATAHAPWYVVPADEQWETRAIVGHLVREQLEALDPRVPKLTDKAKAELAEAKRMLEAE